MKLSFTDFKSLFFIITCSFFFSACNDSQEQIPDISSVPEVNIEIERLEQKLIQQASPEVLSRFFEENPKFSELYFRRSRYPSDSLLIKVVMTFANDPHTDTLMGDVNKVFVEVDEIEKEFEEAFRFVKYYYPDFVVPKVYTMVSGFGAFGFGQDILITESMVVIGLDYFTGKRGVYFPPDTPGYILRRYEPEFIVPNTLKFISTKFNSYDNDDETLLAEMIFYGKALEFTNKMMPHAPDSLIIGYTAEDLQMAEQFQEIIWAKFIENDLFYLKPSIEKSRYVGERPKVVEIADKCPGRIGRWLGWKILQSYLRKNPEISFPEMMANPNAQELFQRSKFRPQSP